MKNKNLLIYGGLAVLGVLAYNYYNKNKKTGYSNASGVFSKTFPGKCDRCRTFEGSVYVPDRNSTCKAGERCLSGF